MPRVLLISPLEGGWPAGQRGRSMERFPERATDNTSPPEAIAQRRISRKGMPEASAPTYFGFW